MWSPSETRKQYPLPVITSCCKRQKKSTQPLVDLPTSYLPISSTFHMSHHINAISSNNRTPNFSPVPSPPTLLPPQISQFHTSSSSLPKSPSSLPFPQIRQFYPCSSLPVLTPKTKSLR